MDQKRLYEQSLDFFLAPLAPLLADDQVTEVLVNGQDSIYFERLGQLHKADLAVGDERWLSTLAQNIAEFVDRKLDATHHSLSGRLPLNGCGGGARVHIVAPPASRNGYSLSIRKFRQRTFSVEELIVGESLTPQAAQFMQLAIELKRNILISGGTGTGKTTLLNALASAIPDDERILVIEETSELRLQQPHVVCLETQQGDGRRRCEVTIRDLFVDSLRLRPDRILVGEVRRGEALDMVQSMLSGHSGAMSTVHAGSPRDALTRLETLCLMTNEALPHHVARLQVASAIHLVVQIERRCGRRRVKSICECAGLNRRGQYRLRPMYRTAHTPLESSSAPLQLVHTGRRPRYRDEAQAYAVPSRFPLLGWMFDEPDGRCDPDNSKNVCDRDRSAS